MLQNQKNIYRLSLLALIFTLFFGSCSINDLLSNSLAGALNGNGAEGQPHPLLSEDDPDLIGDALPFTLKLLDILIGANIDSPPILLTASQAYAAYAALFLQREANTVSRNDFETRTQLLDRSKIHFLRARDYALAALDVRHPGFEEFLNNDDYENAFADMGKDDVPYLYFTAISWFGAATIDIFDLELFLTTARAIEIMNTAYEIDPDYGDGVLHEFYILYFSSLPEQLGGDKARAEFHYREALRLSNNLSTSAHFSMALGISLPAQDPQQFREFMEKVLAIDVDADINRRLTNIIRQREAQWYLDNMALFFLDIE